MASKVIITSRGNFTDNVFAETPPGIPNILIKPLGVLQRLAIKAAKVYLSSLVAFMGASIAGALPGTDPQPLNNFLTVLLAAMQLALVPTMGTVILNASIFFTKLDEKTPELMA